MDAMIRFKRTQGAQEVIELVYEPSKTVGEYLSDMSELYDCPTESIKLIFKGKILAYGETAEKAKIKQGTVMVVINQVKKQPKKTLTSQEQVVPGAGMSTGLGASSPFGVGGYQIVNHPQYMSAISSAVDPDKLEETLNDPQAQGMMEEMLNDPDTLRHLMNQNPMLKNMMKDNPMMKMVLDNPALMKSLFNKETLKKSQEYLKNGGSLEQLQSMANPMMGWGGTGTQTMPNAMNGMQNNQQIPPFQNNPYGMGFGGVNANPSLANNWNSVLANPLFQSQLSQMSDEVRYKDQLKELQLSGFKDRAKNLLILKQVNGDLDSAIEKLCSQ